MARQVQGAAHGETRTHVPEAYGNSESPLEDRVVVHYRVPTERDKRRLQTFGDGTEVIKPKAGDVTVITKQGTNVAKMEFACSEQITKVENYTDRTGAPITNGPEFAEHGEDAFVFEMSGVILGHIDTETTEKKQNASQASSSRAMKVLDGTAESAPSPDLSTQETATATVPISGTSHNEDCNSIAAPRGG